MPSSEICPQDAFSAYPSASAVDAWCDALLRRSLAMQVQGTFVQDNPIRHAFGNGPNTLMNRYVRFDTETGHTFWGYWQPAMKQPAPLLINLPGYGGYISFHPQINDDNYNILHISPLGYVSPDGPDLSRAMEDGNWPVLHHTAMGLPGGYEDWLLDCLLAISWAKTQPGVLADRLSFFGTSQGGGGSLLLASILQGAVRCVCADLPFLTAFPLSGLSGEAYGILQDAYGAVEASVFWNRLGFIDTVSHSHRLTMPVMLSAGGKDQVCPPATIEFLFSRLPGSKQFTFLEDAVHTHSRQSMILCRSWLALHA